MAVILRKLRVLERGFVGWGFWIVLKGVFKFVPSKFGISSRIFLILYCPKVGLLYFSAKIGPFLDGNFKLSAGSPSSNFNPLQVNSYDTYIILMIVNNIGYVKN